MVKIENIEIGQIIKGIKIIGIGTKGDGFTKFKGLVIFVKDSKLNGIYKIKITNKLNKVAFADIIK